MKLYDSNCLYLDCEDQSFKLLSTTGNHCEIYPEGIRRNFSVVREYTRYSTPYPKNKREKSAEHVERERGPQSLNPESGAIFFQVECAPAASDEERTPNQISNLLKLFPMQKLKTRGERERERERERF